MSEARTVTPSHAELVVLGCLAQRAVPSDDDLGNAVRELWLRHETQDRARATALSALAKLRERGLVDQRKLTKAGTEALRTACGVSQKPAWSTFRQRYFPAIALGVLPGPVKKNAPDAMAQRLARKLGLSEVSTMNGLCDALIGNALQMGPGTVTLARIRAQILALRVHAAAKATSGPGSHPDVPESPPKPAGEPPPIPAPNAQAPDLLEFVRETLTEIGDDGRFGDEKVFVSVLWHELAHRGPPAELSLDHFKQWLVTANRNHWLTLARADVVGAMDPKKVRESEIQDRGATFHFVLDPARNPAAQQGSSHVR